MNDDLKKLSEKLPPVFARTEIRKLLGGIISPGYLANLDSAGLGPPRVRIGPRKVGYHREPFIEWLAARSKTNLSGCCNQGAK